MHLNNKSYYSLGKATTSPKQIIDFAVNNQLSSIGLIDINTTQGFDEFLDYAETKKIKAIVGIQTVVTYQNKMIDVILIAKDNQSFSEINYIISENSKENYISIEKIKNLIIIVINNHELDFELTNLYIGLRRDQLINIQKITEKMILIDETYFLENDFDFYKIYRSINENKIYRQNKLLDNKHKYLHKISLSSQYQLLDINYQSLVKKINYQIDKKEYKIPSFSIDQDSDVYLSNLCNLGLNKRLNQKTDEKYQKRLNYELEVIAEMNFTNYFLIVWDLIKYCKKSNIYFGPGRGSSASSLVAYCLGITNVDPIKYDLLFERFLNNMRLSMPDIDLDFEDKRREDVVSYLKTTYGCSHVCKIGTLNRYQVKGAFREIAQTLEVDKNTISYISKNLDMNYSFKQNLKINKKLAKEFLLNSDLKYMFDFISRLENIPRNTSIHASGIIIADENLLNYTAVNKEGVSLLDAHSLEKKGLVKLDILSLSTLSFIHDVVDKIQENVNVNIDVNNLDLNDSKVYDLLAKGYTYSIFQMESNGMVEVLKKYKPKTFDDIALLLSIYRPGPMKNIDQFIKRKNEKNKINYTHPYLEEILGYTYGIIVYQEQIIQIVQKLANYDLAQADIFRRVISKKESVEMKLELENFKQKAVDNKINIQVINKISDDILEFANYGFNKAHAYSYSKIVYSLLYLKVNYPVQYYNCLINKNKNIINQINSELNYLKINILRPDILTSSKKNILYKNSIQLGIHFIKLLTDSDQNMILEKRNKLDLDQLNLSQILDKLIIPLKLEEKQIYNLVFSGLFSHSKLNEKSIINYILDKSNIDIDALGFFNQQIGIIEVDNFSLKQCEEYEYQALGLNIKYNTFENYYVQFKKVNPKIILIEEIDIHYNNQAYDVIGVLKEISEFKTKTGDIMAELIIKSITSEYKVMIFKGEYSKYKNLLKNNIKHFLIFNIISRSRGLSIKSIIEHKKN